MNYYNHINLSAVSFLCQDKLIAYLELSTHERNYKTQNTLSTAKLCDIDGHLLQKQINCYSTLTALTSLVLIANAEQVYVCLTLGKPFAK